ncbi:MAG: adenine deaminase C-terminal domain-containing protein, partial [Desulfatiglandales bacterium]|nr:adenine deaminase C-terminal domain-containing protein [Desulfatiglandales bacterium]
KVLVPGYIEPHSHPWNIYNPISLGEEACRLGTTTLFCDNLFFFTLLGIDLFEALMTIFLDMPIKFFWSCRAVPQTPMEREDVIYSLDNLQRLLKNHAVQSLGEITRWPELLKGNPKIMKIINHAKGLRKRIDGHTAGAKYEKLNDIARAGVASCHESISPEEVLDRLRLGFYVMLRESSLRQDLRFLLKAIGENSVLTDRMMLTTDGASPEFYRQFGVTNNLIKIAIGEGIDPILVYRMSTINPAVYFGLDHAIGGIAPGRYADILVLKDLFHPTPEMVISKGRIVAENGTLLEPFPDVNWERLFPKSTFVKRTWCAKSHLFKMPCNNKSIKFPTIKLINSVITRKEWVEFDVKDGFLDLTNRKGFCFSALLNRDGKWVTNGILQGFGGAIEGLASSFNTATEILVIGRQPRAMSAAVNRMFKINGGIVAIENDKIVYEFPLPLGGKMSEAPMQKLAEKEKELKGFLQRRGYPFHDPFYTLLFLPNDFLPEIRINYNGVFDIKKGKTLWPRRDLT